MNNDKSNTNAIVTLLTATIACPPLMSDPVSTSLTGGLSSDLVVFGWFLSSALVKGVAVAVVMATVVAAYKESGEGLILIS